jgi:hypothetical protein
VNQSALVLADAEHYCAELLDHVAQRPEFEMLVPMRMTRHVHKQVASIPATDFVPRWAGLEVKNIFVRELKSK